jgi:hypothetical protein
MINLLVRDGRRGAFGSAIIHRPRKALSPESLEVVEYD